jgi:hypothetical protein
MGRFLARRMRSAAGVVVACIVVLWARASWAQSPIVLRGEETGRYAGESLAMAVDPSAELTAEQMASGERFEPATSRHPNLGFTRSAVWFRFTLENASDRERTYVLDTGREWVDTADVHPLSALGSGAVMRSGASVPLARRPLQTERIAFPLTLAAGQRETYLVRLRSRSSLALDGEIVPLERFVEDDARGRLGYGGFYSILLAMAAYNALLFLVLREKSQALLTSTLVAYAIAESCSHGHLSRLFPSGAGVLELSGASLGFSGFVYGLTAFTRTALATGTSLPRMDRMMAILGPAAALVCLVAAVFPVLNPIQFVAIATPLTVTLIAGVRETLRGRRNARWFTLAVAAFILPATFTIVTLFGMVPLWPSIDQGNHAGSVAMSCLLALTIAEGIRAAREQAASLQRDTASLNLRLTDKLAELEEKHREVGRLNEELQHQVVARSRELGNALARIDAPLPVTRLATGDLFAGRYRIIRPLGEGGMGSVHEVERLSDQKRFALKVVAGALSGSAAARMAREAEIGATLRHPNVVSIVDVGVTSSGAPYLVMDLVRGGSLEAERSHFGDASWAVSLLAPVVRGLAALHDKGIVHRDLKPANVLLDRERGQVVPKIADFGISRMGETSTSDPEAATMEASTPLHSGPRLTGTGTMLGTPFYMPPEAAAGKGVGTAADVFAFGVLAYEMLTGASPFPAPPLYLAMARLPLPVPAPVTGLRPALAKVLLDCLSEDPAARPSVRQLLEVIGAEGPAETAPPARLGSSGGP